MELISFTTRQDYLTDEQVEYVNQLKAEMGRKYQRGLMLFNYKTREIMLEWAIDGFLCLWDQLDMVADGKWKDSK